jgi:hypothetical protein
MTSRPQNGRNGGQEWWWRMGWGNGECPRFHVFVFLTFFTFFPKSRVQPQTFLGAPRVRSAFDLRAEVGEPPSAPGREIFRWWVSLISCGRVRTRTPLPRECLSTIWPKAARLSELSARTRRDHCDTPSPEHSQHDVPRTHRAMIVPCLSAQASKTLKLTHCRSSRSLCPFRVLACKRLVFPQVLKMPSKLAHVMKEVQTAGGRPFGHGSLLYRTWFVHVLLRTPEMIASPLL